MDKKSISEGRHLANGLFGLAWLAVDVSFLRSGLHNIGFWLKDLMRYLTGGMQVFGDPLWKFILYDLSAMIPALLLVAAAICFVVLFVRGRPARLLPISCALHGVGLLLQDAVILLLGLYVGNIASFVRGSLVWLAIFACMWAFTFGWKRYLKRREAENAAVGKTSFPFLREFVVWWKKCEAREFEETGE